MSMRGGRRGSVGARAGRWRARAAAGVAASLLLVACSSGGGEGSAPGGAGSSVPSRPTPTLADDGVTTPEARAHPGDWPLAGRDYRNSRAVPESAITAATVDRLEEVWQAPLPGTGAIGNASTTPLIIGDRVVVQDLVSNVRVFDRATGALVWERPVGVLNTGPNGVAVGWGRVYAPKGSKEVMALDLETGEEKWSVPITATPTEGITIQPQVAGDLVLVSTVPVSIDGVYTGGDRGVLHALDAATGAVRWKFDTVDGDLWGNPAVNSGGGAWFPPSVDVDAGVVYWGTGNPAPFPGTPEFPNGSSRPGPNLYTDSVLAIDLRTGALRWADQVIPHDIFDRDHVHTMIVPTADGTTVVSAGKSGIVVGHDPATGVERWRTALGIRRNADLTELSGPTEIWPGTYGGVLTPPASADGTVYVAVINAGIELAPDKKAYVGSPLNQAPGELVAVDARDGSVKWKTELPGDPLGGATVVGDLVFTATFEGKILALSRADGHIVREIEAPGGINGWPAVAGDLIVWPLGLGEPAVLWGLRLRA